MANNKIYLYGYIMSSWWGNSAESISEQIAPLESDDSVESIELHIHSYGGEVFEGNAIYNVIKACKKPVDVIIDGVAASMATIVMLAGRSLTMLDNAYLMIHEPFCYAGGTATELEDQVRLLREMETQLKEYYAAKTGNPSFDISGEKWYSARQALEAKLIDKITSQLPTGAPVLEDEDEHEMPCRESELPNAKLLLTKYAAQARKISKPNNNKPIITSMTDEEKAEMQRIKDENARLQAEKEARDAADAAANDAEIESEVEAAVKNGKIKAENKATFVTVGKTSGLAVLKTVLATKEAPKSITAMLENAGGNEPAPSVWEKRQQEIEANYKKQ